MPYGTVDNVTGAYRWHRDHCDFDPGGDDADTCWCHCKSCPTTNPHWEAAKWREPEPDQ